ncbi:hypothetical protein BDR26DRAFT_862298 [Obelidium mucronatum]|nr:hypothetical protein BDR26DRAFT_862298 [Obelidium mucronatum]
MHHQNRMFEHMVLDASDSPNLKPDAATKAAGKELRKHFYQQANAADKLHFLIDRMKTVASSRGTSQTIVSPSDSVAWLTGAQHECNEKYLFDQCMELAKEGGIGEKLVDVLHGALKDMKTGSGVNGEPLNRLFCCRGDPADPTRACTSPATFFCSNCHLHSYCSKECQKTQWSLHKGDCKRSPQGATWRPQWEVEGYEPNLVGARNQIFSQASAEYLWGNMEAVDVFNLSDEEVGFAEFRAVFAASGDFRDVIMSVNGLRSGSEFCNFNIHVNDWGPMAAARNLLLLVLLAHPDNLKLVDAVIATWYSVCMTDSQMAKIQEILLPLLALGPNAKQWTVGKTVIHLGNGFDGIFHMLVGMSSNSLGLHDGMQKYHDLMMTMDRIDFRHRIMLDLLPYERLAWFEQRNFGLLLPFGSFNAHHNTLNKFLFHPIHGFNMFDSCEKLDGWNQEQVLESGKQAGCSSNDLYGCLFFHVRQQLVSFISKIAKHKIVFHFSCQNALNLATSMTAQNLLCDRIWVSNISDQNYVGLTAVKRTFLPLCNRVLNPNSVLITLFMNWITTTKLTSDLRIRPRYLKLTEEKAAKLFDNGTPFYTTTMLSTPQICLFDLWPLFEEWLKEAFGKDGVGFREVNSVVPRRVRVPVGAKNGVLPEKEARHRFFTSDRSMYVEWK